jgi:hypothetical protein
MKQRKEAKRKRNEKETKRNEGEILFLSNLAGENALRGTFGPWVLMIQHHIQYSYSGVSQWSIPDALTYCTTSSYIL